MKLKTLFLCLICTGVFAPTLSAQDSTQCDCQASFDELTRKLEANYIGYALRKDQIESDYRDRIKDFRPTVNGIDALDCVSAMQRFLSFFDDGHLFASQYPKYSEEENGKFKSSLRQRLYAVDSLKDHLAAKRESLSALEGVWTDGTTGFAVVHNNNKDWPYEFVAVILSSSQPEKIGELKLGVNYKDGEYEGAYYSNAYSPRYVKLDLAKDNTLLGIWGGLFWGRVSYSDRISLDSSALYNPTLPTIEHLEDSTVLLTIPTFLLEKPSFDSVLFGNQVALTTCRNLIIDIRGNSGGNGIYFNLMSLYAEKPLTSEIGLTLASTDNLTYFTQFARGGTSDPYQPVVDDMKQNMGKILKGPRFSDSKLPQYPSNLRKVVILTDRTNISAAETFILHSKGSSDKVVTIGTNTGGVVDYNNINMVRIGCEHDGIYFGYPTFTLNDHILKDGYNNKGISPDISSDKKGRDLITFALEYLNR